MSEKKRTVIEAMNFKIDLISRDDDPEKSQLLFTAKTHCTAADLTGRIEINAVFDLEGEQVIDMPTITKYIDSFETIQLNEPLPDAETIFSLLKEKDTPDEAGDQI